MNSPVDAKEDHGGLGDACFKTWAEKAEVGAVSGRAAL